RPWSETGRRLRELQAEWQDHARRLPLPRAVEASLWARFRAACDAVFTQRDAAAAARDATLVANLSAGEALLERLQALRAETPPADIERTLAEVDRAWRQIGDLPRGAAEAIEARLRTARAEAARWLGAATRQRWQAGCDALQARLALCEAREDGAGDALEAATPWEALGALPAPWAQALTQRWSRSAAPGPLDAAAVDVLLLQLETALELPITPERQEERRQLKLRALKDAMEGRTPARQGAAPPAEGLLALLRQGGLSAVQRARLHEIAAALRQAPPGTLVAPKS
ncbi:MAG TPA: DUF349 domain-containing protein, partial [Rubrivivax sp.]|nr:DUF349 domain-containing protein [Rubrivivax sp.]